MCKWTRVPTMLVCVSVKVYTCIMLHLHVQTIHLHLLLETCM